MATHAVPKRRADEEAESRKRERQDGVMAKVQALDAEQAKAHLNVLCERWQLSDTQKSVDSTMARIVENTQLDNLAFEAGSFGLRELDDILHEQEMEAVALYHRMREHGLFEDPELLRRSVKIMEMVYYARRMATSVLQANLAAHTLHSDTMVLDSDLDARLGSWSLRFRWIDDNTTPVQKLLLHLLEIAMEKRYRKLEGICFEPILLNSGVKTHAWREVCEIRDFVFREAQKETQWEQWCNLTNGANNMRFVVDYLTNCKDYQFPELVKQRDVFSFRNGVYLARTDTFHRYADPEPLGDNVVACKFFDADFDPYEDLAWRDIPTPHLQSILDYQEFAPEVSAWLYVFVGRLLYQLNDLDSWQVIPFFKGQASSGKCFARGTMVRRWDGSVVAVEDVVEGDLLMGDDATPRTVLSLARGMDTLYRVEGGGAHMDVTLTHVLCLVWRTEKVLMTVAEFLDLPRAVQRRTVAYRQDGTTYSIDIEELPGLREFFGFQTDANRKFCLEDGTVCHNSTIALRVCKALYDPIHVAVLSNNIERKFGISAFHDKYLFVGPEVKSDLALDQCEFQSIVSGEDIQVNVKHKKAFSTTWRVPGVLAGNEVPSWCDNSGSIQRRVVVFDFSKTVANGDMKLGEKLEMEMPSIIVKANRAYLEQVAQHSQANIWTILPEYFRGTRDEMAQSVNAVEAFIASSNVVLGADRYCPFDTFKNGLKAFALQNNFQTSKFTWDFFRGPLTKYGITKTRGVREYRGKSASREHLLGVDLTDNESAEY